MVRDNTAGPYVFLNQMFDICRKSSFVFLKSPLKVIPFRNLDADGFLRV